MLYVIFDCLAISSTSGERRSSKLKVSKNRLLSTLADDYLSALMILAAEKDLFHALTDEKIMLKCRHCKPASKSANAAQAETKLGVWGDDPQI